MIIGRILYPITTLGPGNRLVIWTCGCSKHCSGCISPEWWEATNGNYYDLTAGQLGETIERLIESQQPDGITISGGDPLEQADELLDVLERISKKCSDILVYTGFTLSELQANCDKANLRRLTDNTSVLIDGRYEEALNDNKSPLRGSTNQSIHFFNESLLDKYKLYMKENGRTIQPVQIDDQQILIGIFNKGGSSDAD